MCENVNVLNDTFNSDHDRPKELLQGNKLSLNIIKIQAMVKVSRPSLKKIDQNKEEIPSFVFDEAETDIFKKTKIFRSQTS